MPANKEPDPSVERDGWVTWGERLVSHESMFAGASLHIPDPDAGVQAAGHDVDPVKLEIRGVIVDNNRTW